jgi:crossover junction endodeoxyribonuclease RuvC
MVNSPRIILGIDPGTNLLGYGIIKVDGKTPVLETLGVVRLNKIEDHGEKLFHIFERIVALISGFGVTEVAIEAPFYGKNVQSMLKLGRAQGVAIAAAISKNLPVYEYVPRKIKPETLDASDGLAAALCHLYQFQPRTFGTTKNTGKKSGGWAQFLKENPDRVE